MPTRPPYFASKHRAPTREQTRGSSSSRGYDADWRRARDYHLTNVQALCEVCLSRGRTTAATIVDHVVPIAANGGEQRRLDPSNFRSCCVACHADITANYKTTGINEPRELATGFWA